MKSDGTTQLTARIAARRSLPEPAMRRAIRRAAGASLEEVAAAGSVALIDRRARADQPR